MSIRPIQVWGHWGAPNPWKVCIVLEELSIPYDLHILELSQAKEEPYLAINPNGRLPAIQDPNHDLTLWEGGLAQSGAIVQYLIEQYDKEKIISYEGIPERYLTQQWLAFQISGQGPYFGQATWFARFHHEKLPSAINRYIDEIFRVTAVLDMALERGGTGWLVGDQLTYADLAFVTWASVAEGLLGGMGKLDELESQFPRYVQWRQAMEARESVKKIRDQMTRGRAEHGLD